LYIVVALVTPLLHHDVACHLQSKTHCDACIAHSMASGVESSAAPGNQAGKIEPCVPGDAVAKAFAERPAAPGRAPPAASRIA